jgi:signal transduction histidine kinase
MPKLWATGYPANRAAARRAVDVLITAFVAVSWVPSLFGTGEHPAPPKMVALTLSAVPLLVRRKWPVPVFCCILLISLSGTIWATFSIVNGTALLVALYTVADRRPLRESVTCGAAVCTAVVAFIIGTKGIGWWYPATFTCGLFAGAIGLGLYTRTRRAYLAELQDRARRLERERDQQGALAAAAERARIARETHDIVAHNLMVMITLSEAAIAAQAASPERAAEVMRKVSATGRNALTDTRRLLGVLRQEPGQAAGDGFQPTPGLAQVSGLIEQVRSAGLKVALEVAGDVPDLAEGVQLTVYRLVQEALTNTLKHAGASASATVRLRFTAGDLLLDIEDDGAGASQPTRSAGGGGLLGMRERVRVYAGDLVAGPRQPHGWRVSARLNLHAT